MNKKAIIKIEDEVNVRISGLELGERKTLMKLFSFDVPGARYLPAVRLGRWNGKTSFFSIGGASYVNLLEEIIPVIDNAGYDIELEDSRQYSTTFNFATVSADTFKHKNWPKGHPVEGQPVILRDYQIDLVNNFLSNPQCLQQAATGAGKTLVTAALSYSIESYGRSIIIVPNVTLVTQTEKDYINLGLDVGVYYGGRKEYGKTHTICTWQSLNAMMKNTKSGEAEVTITDFLEGVVCVICDECFDGSSLVLTVSGYKPIQSLKEGDIILNYSEERKIFKEDTIIKVHTNLTNSSDEKMFELEFDNNEKIKVTGNHKFLTTLGWVRADELTENHEIISTSINTCS